MSDYLCTAVISRPLLFALLSTSLLSCERIVERKIFKQGKQDTVYVYDTIYLKDTVVRSLTYDWQEDFDLTHDETTDTIAGMPAEFYLSDPECNALAFDFYYGNFRPKDNASTGELLDLALTSNDKLRPFYRWCLDMTIMVSDGALAEYPGVPALNYVTTYPQEFFEFIDEKENPLSYQNWVSIIQYSGLPDYQANSEKTYNEIKHKILINCNSCSDALKERIRKFAFDVSGMEEVIKKQREDEELPDDQ